MAAVLACGPGACASHYCAGVLLHLGLGVRRLIDVTAPRSRGRTREGICVHSSAALLSRDVTLIDNIPEAFLAVCRAAELPPDATRLDPVPRR